MLTILQIFSERIFESRAVLSNISSTFSQSRARSRARALTSMDNPEAIHLSCRYKILANFSAQVTMKIDKPLERSSRFK